MWVTAVIIVCVIAGVDNSDLQARISLAALLVGFVGSIFLLIRARRSPVSERQQVRTTASAPPPLPIAPEVQHETSRSEEPAEVGGYEAKGLPLSGIHDANAQTINKRGVDVLASLGEKNPKHKTVHHYNVNLSGDFGARRLMFRSKFKRDQFLSILRALRPSVRITRWS
jgi:hypothetical protein